MNAGRTCQEIAVLAQARLAEIIEADPGEIGLDIDLFDELGMDSLQQLELLTVLERDLSIRLTSEEWRHSRTLSELAELLSRGDPLP